MGITAPNVSWAVIAVNTTTDEDTDNSDCSIREAIIAVKKGENYNGCTYDADHIIQVPAGTYTLTNGQLEVNFAETLSIVGATASPADTIIEGSATKPSDTGPYTGDKRVFKIAAANAIVTIENITLRHGQDDNTGGAIYKGSDASITLTLKNCKVVDNASKHGGAIYNHGTLIIDNTEISGNLAYNGNGGGIRNFTNGVIVVKNNSKIINNKSTLCGGGIVSNNTTAVTIENSQLTGNLYKLQPNDLVGDTSGMTITASTITAAYKSCQMSTLVQIDGYAKADDASQLSTDEIKDAFTSDDDKNLVSDANLEGYKTAVEDASEVPDEAALKKIVENTNAGKTAIGVIQAYAADPTDLTKDITINDLSNAGASNVSAANLEAYKAAIVAAKNAGVTIDAGELQKIVDTTNLQKIQSFANGSDNLAIDQLTGTNQLKNVDSSKFAQYQAAIKAAGGSGISSWAALQAIIDSVNSGSTSNDTSSGSSFSVPPPQSDYYKLNIASANGHVTSDKKDIEGKAIDCNKGEGHCSGSFKRGTKITLTTTAPVGLIFDSWGGHSDCSDSKVIMNGSRNCQAIFYGDPNYVAPETDKNTDTSTNGTASGDGTGDTGSTSAVYVNSFSIRAKIQGKNACYLNAFPHPNDVVVAGFILQGIGSETVFIRALDLEQGTNPKIILSRTVLGSDGILRGVPITKNDAWELDPNSQNIPSSLKPEKQTDAALLVRLAEGAYTVTMCMSPNNEIDSGVALVSVTLLDNVLHFGSVSGRGYVSGGADDAIAGFSVYGNLRQTARIEGYALGQTPDTFIDSKLDIGSIYFDPQINQVSGNRLKSVSSWRDEVNGTIENINNHLSHTDAATLMSFEPGHYTTTLSSENGVTGLGIMVIDFAN